MSKNQTILLLQTQNLAYGYPKNILLNQLNLQVQKGDFIALLGVNGAGKSTLLRTLAGLQKPIAGKVLLKDIPLNQYTTAQLSLLRSIILTDKIEVNHLKVYDLIAMGRYPHIGWLGKLTQKDHQMIQNALEMTETTHFSQSYLHQLSDGERQKVMIARALAQDTDLIFLDEPTAHLDLPNSVMIFKLLQKLSTQTGKTILLATHELTWALQICQTIWLLYEENQLRKMVCDTPKALIEQNLIQQAFQREGLDFDRESLSFRLV